MRNLIGLLQFHIKACVDQLSYDLSLIQLSSACPKQNAAAKTAGSACSLIAK